MNQRPNQRIIGCIKELNKWVIELINEQFTTYSIKEHANEQISEPFSLWLNV